MTFAPTDSKAPFLPTTQVFPEDDSQRLIVHTDTYTQISQNVNIRQLGTYDKIEQVAGQFFFNDTTPSAKRLSYRQVYSIGAIAQGATSITAHGITGVNTTTTFTHIYATCVTDVIDNRPIPYASATLVTDQIEINVDGTNINIINGATAPAITSAIVVLEYLKN